MGLGFREVAKEITSALNLGEDEGKIDALAGIKLYNSPHPAEIYSQELTFGCRKKKTAAVVFHLGSEFTTHLACSPVCVDS